MDATSVFYEMDRNSKIIYNDKIESDYVCKFVDANLQTHILTIINSN